MRRVCIYLTYDGHKIVDRYIGHMLRELRTCVDTLVVVCNEDRVLQGVEILEEHADEIYYRENIGLDAGGFKEALCCYLGWDRVLQYEELLLVNDSFFGPFCPMKEVFGRMEDKKVDFWGLTKHGELRNSCRGDFAEHIQSYFICIRSRMLHGSQFRRYWEDQPFYRSFDEVVFQHEVKFTAYFASLGYTYDVLADNDVNNTAVNLSNNYSQYALLSYELIRKRKFPFLKRQPFSYNLLDGIISQTQENLRQSIDYIDKETDYDVELIWENLVRTMNVTDLQRSMHLQYLIPPGGERRCGDVVMVAAVSNPGTAEYVTEYLAELPSYVSVLAVSADAELLTGYRNRGMECRILPPGGLPELLPEFCSHDFVCVVHDADLASDVRPSCVGKSYFYSLWENLAKNSGHISGILDCFEREPRLGFLAPPQPVYGEYFGEYGKGWNGAYKAVRRTVERLGLRCRISEQLPPFRATDSFWIRGCILEKLKGLQPEELWCFPYLPVYLAQDAGYYSGIVESMEYASMHEVNLQYYLSQMGALHRRWCGEFQDFPGMRDSLRLCAAGSFCRKHARIYIYGAGEDAHRYSMLLPEAEGCIVSDGQEKPEKMDGKPVKYLSEIPLPEDCGIVLCLNEKNQGEVIPLLEERGLTHYFCM